MHHCRSNYLDQLSHFRREETVAQRVGKAAARKLVGLEAETANNVSGFVRSPYLFLLFSDKGEVSFKIPQEHIENGDIS